MEKEVVNLVGFLVRLIIITEVLMVGFGITYVAIELGRWLPYWAGKEEEEEDDRIEEEG